MKPVQIAVLAVAVVAAAGSALLARDLMSTSDSVADQAATTDTVDVLVASREIVIGETVTSADVSWQPWPDTAAQSGFIRRDATPEGVEDYTGAIARMGILSGEPINDTKLVRSDTAGFLSAILPEGMRAISTAISPETGAGGFILPNDRVDVIVTRREQASETSRREKHISETVLTNVRVLAIDQEVAERDGKKVVIGKTATLELRPEQAEALALAQSMGEIALSLRSLRDVDDDGGQPMTVQASEPETEEAPAASVSLVRYGFRNHVTTTGR